MIPVANFLVTPNLLIVDFTDISTNNPTSWSWDFGDGTNSTSNNPSHTYTSSGTYNVKLIATNSDGSSSLTRQILISTSPILPVSLKTFLNIKLNGLIITEEIKDAYIAQWQLFLQPLVYPPIDLSLVFNEAAYPPLANALIAMLAAYSIFSDQMSQSGVVTSTSNGGGAVKKIVTGPSEVEFQDLGKTQSSFFGEGGAMQSLQKEICMLSSRLMIFLPMCPPLPDPKILYVKAGRKSHSSLWSNFPCYKLSI